MALLEQTSHWTPTAGFHGEIPLPSDGDIEGAILKAVMQVSPNRQLPYFADIKYILRKSVRMANSGTDKHSSKMVKVPTTVFFELV